MVRWTNCRVKLRELVPWDENPRKMTKKQAQRILDSFRSFGQFQTIAIGPNNEVYDGHQRLSALRTVHGDDYELDARRADRPLTDEERRQLVIYAHISATGSWDWDKLSAWDAVQVSEWGANEDIVAAWRDDSEKLEQFLKKREVKKGSKPELSAEQWYVIIECDSEEQQTMFLDEFIERGIKCRATQL